MQVREEDVRRASGLEFPRRLIRRRIEVLVCDRESPAQGADWAGQLVNENDIVLQDAANSRNGRSALCQRWVLTQDILADA